MVNGAMMMCYDDGMRTIIDLPEDQLRALAEYCTRERVSRAEAVRRAVNVLVNADDQRMAERREALAAAVGMWKDRGIDGVEYQRQLRAEWDGE
jgi:metal-responsive CopG/Arc/MetJ family transcriptional regulator